MLVLKKISTRKLTIYVLIIVLMTGGTGLMLYQNQRLTGEQPIAVDDLARYDKFMPVGTALPGIGTTTNQRIVDPLGANKIKNNQGIDLTIFSLEKFKALEANIIIPQADSGLGKRDLFKPN